MNLTNLPIFYRNIIMFREHFLQNVSEYLFGLALNITIST